MPLSVLRGQNGTGKTTLLELVASSDFSRLLPEPLDVEYEFASATGRITARMRNVPTGRAGPEAPGPIVDRATAPRDMAWPLSTG